jgi:outer membrane protein assembly factor BamB
VGRTWAWRRSWLRAATFAIVLQRSDREAAATGNSGLALRGERALIPSVPLRFFLPEIPKSPKTVMQLTSRLHITIVLAGLVVGHASAGAPADAENWPQWRGPLANGVAPNANPPVTWSESSNVKWKVRIPGRGSATPVIWGNQVFVQTAVGTGAKSAAQPAEAPLPPPPPAEGKRGGPGGKKGFGGMSTGKPSEEHQFVLLSLDRGSGKVQWQKTLETVVPHEGHHPADGTYASASPVTDGKHVYAFFGSRGLHCCDLQGNMKWKKDLGQMRIKMGFGEGSSPALFEDKLIVNWDHESGAFIAVFDKTSGRELWRQSRDEETSWATPLVVVLDGKPQVVTSATRRVRSYELATGKLRWECTGMTANVIPTPVAGEGLVYAISGFRGNLLLAIRPGASGDVTGTEAIAWSYKKNTPYVPSPLLYEGRLHFLSNNNAVLTTCEAKTGQVLIDAARLAEVQSVYASPVGAAGRVYFVGRNGVTAVLKSGDTLEVMATNRLEEKFDASPALVGRELFLRGKEHLYCLAER